MCVTPAKFVKRVKVGRLNMDEKERKRKMELCKNCYTCEQGVSSDITIDDRKEKQVQMTEEQKAKLCRNCYTCQQNVGGGRQVLTPGEKERLCKNCYTCQQNIGTGKGKGKKSVSPEWFCWYLFPTNACNLSCSYCYANNKPGYMSKEMMHKMLTWLFSKQPHKNLTCHFFGGEPTVMWDMLVDIIQLGNAMAKSNGYNVRWSMTSNGVLLDKTKLDFIEANFRQGNPFLLSIDGRPKTHNKYRVFADGKPSHHLIPIEDILRRFPNIECRPTINPDTAKDWFEDYRWLRNKGFRNIAIEPNFEVDWTAKQLQDFEQLIEQLGRYWVYAYKAGKPIHMKFIDGTLKALGSTQDAPVDRMCGVAFNSGGIDYRGQLYACQRYASYNDPDSYALGDVENGWDEFKLLETQNLFRSQVNGDITQGYNCSTCSIRKFCFKGCNAANKKFMGKREISMPMYCALAIIEVKVGLQILAEMNLLGAKQSQQCQRC
jgi:uncharacterized protein